MATTEYFTKSELEAWSGLGASDFRQGGSTMSAEQWTAFVTLLEKAIRTAINTFCRRSTFISSTYTEYHDGRGYTGDYEGYTESDRIFHLREQPVVSVTTVSEDVAGKTGVPSWTDRTARADGVAGDYEVITRSGATYVRFITNIPRQGYANVKIVYVAGYAEGDDVFDDIRGIALDMAAKHLQRKKRMQEAAAARNPGTRDAASMVPIGDPNILTDDIKARLYPYRRGRAGGKMWR